MNDNENREPLKSTDELFKFLFGFDPKFSQRADATGADTTDDSLRRRVRELVDFRDQHSNEFHDLVSRVQKLSESVRVLESALIGLHRKLDAINDDRHEAEKLLRRIVGNVRVSQDSTITFPELDEFRRTLSDVQEFLRKERS